MREIMAISLSSFKNQYDNKPKQTDFSDWKHFERFLYALAERPLGGKRDAELISPAVYEPGTRRANKNVLSWAGWCAVDVDDIELGDDNVNDYVDTLSDWRYVCYSTASSKEEQPKFRIVFQLDRDVVTQEIKHFWYALQSYLDEAGDKQCKDLSRMYYVPATYDSAFNFIFSGGSEPLVVSDLHSKYPYVEKKNSNNFIDRLPEKLQRQVIEHRKSKMEATQYNWSGYTDCPFWPTKLANEYRGITGTGWYHKMYQIMVAISARAISKGYPIRADQVAELCKEFDRENGNWYESRPLEVEADRALEYAYKNI